MAGNWRGERSKAVQPKAGAAPSTEKKRAPIGWRRAANEEQSKKSTRVLLRRTASIAAVLLIAAALVGLYLLLKPVRSRLYVDVASYSADLAAPAETMRSEDLAELLPNIEVVQVGGSGSVPDDRSEVAIIFVSAAVQSGAGGPFLIDDRANPDGPNPSRIQPLKSDERPATAAEWIAPFMERAKARPTLLILDVAEPRVNWRAGVLAPFPTQAFLEDLQREIASVANLKEPKPKIAVLASAWPGERSWSNHGRRYFHQAVLEGLHGAADGAVDGRTNRRVTARELHRFVSNRTMAWVIGHRDESGQHAIWIDSGADFDISYASSGTFRWPDRAQGDPDVVKQLESAWQKRDAIWDSRDGFAALSAAPLEWRRANYLLLQAERSYRARQLTAAKEAIRNALASLDRMHSTVNATFQPPVAAADQLASFREYVPSSVSSELFASAVEARSKAHAVLTSSPRSLPLIESVVAKGDSERRQAEDAVFLGQADSVRAHHSQAEEAYKSAAEISQYYDAARQDVERLLAGLPELADWAAVQPISLNLVRSFIGTGGRASSSLVGEDELTRLARLFAETRRLRVELDRIERNPPAPPAALADALGGLADQTRAAVEELKAIEDSLKQQAEELLNRADKVTSRRLIRRQSLELVLANPLLNGSLRGKLIAELESLDDSLDTAGAATDTTSTAERPGRSGLGENPEWNSDSTRQELSVTACWQGLWALLVRSLDPSSDHVIDELWQNGWDTVATQAQLAAAQRPEDAETARKAAVWLGDRLRLSWKASYDQVARTRSYSEGDEAVWLDLVHRDRIGRCLHGYDAGLVINQRKRDPAAELAAWTAASTSVFLAHQAVDDFYAGTPGSPHWYETACRFHLDEATNIVRGIPAVSPVIAALGREVRELLEARQGTRFWLRPDSDRVVFGSSDRKQAKLRLDVEGRSPSGAAAVWLSAPSSAGERPTTVRLDSKGRQGIAVGTEEASGASVSSFDLVRVSPSCDGVPVPAHVFFRGHGAAERVVVSVDPCPPRRRTVVTKPAPETGELIVNGTDRRSILFALDCSDSMRAAIGDDGTKMGVAKRILAETIQAIRDEAESGDGHRVGLMAFGHRMNTRRANDFNEKWKNELPRSASEDYQLLVPLRDPALGPDGVDPFAIQLARLEPFGITPLINTIREAVRTYPSGTPGTVVVITDGVDTTLEKGTEAQKRAARAALQDLSRQLRERKAKDAPVEVHLVGFAIDRQSQDLLNEIGSAVCGPSGGVQLAATDAEKLATVLREAIRQRHYQVVPAGRSEGLAYNLGEPAENLPRGDYRIVFPDAVPREISIAGGERLAIDLRNGRLTPRKYQWGGAPDDRAIASGPVGDGPDLLVDRRYVTSGADGLIRVSLDRARDRVDAGGTPQISQEGFVPRPADVAFAVTDGDGNPVSNLIVETAVGYDLPTWDLTITPVPSDQRITVTAFWRMNPPAQDPALILSEADIGREITVPTEAGDLRLILKKFGPSDQRPGDIVARLESGQTGTFDSSIKQLEHLWMKLDPGPVGASRFRPIEVETERTYFFDDGAIEFSFSAGPQFEFDGARIGVVPPPSQSTGAAQATLHFRKAD